MVHCLLKKTTASFLALTLLLSACFCAPGGAEGEEPVRSAVITKNPANWTVIDEFGMKTELWNYPTPGESYESKPVTFYDSTVSKTNCKDLLLGTTFIQTTGSSTDRAVQGQDLTENDVFGAVELNHPADIYLAVFTGSWSDKAYDPPAYPPADNYLPWLRPDTTAPFGGGYEKVMVGTQPAAINLSNGQVMHVYKKTVDVPDGETATVEFGGLIKPNVGSLRMYSIFIDWKESYQMGVTVTDKGTVTKTNGTAVQSGDSIRVLAGEEVSLQITPDPGCYIDSVKVDGEIIAEDMLEQYTLNYIPEADCQVEIAFSNEYPLEYKLDQKMKDNLDTGLVYPSVTFSGSLSAMLAGKSVAAAVAPENGEETVLKGAVDEKGGFAIEFLPPEAGNYTVKLSLELSAQSTVELASDTFTVSSVEKINALLQELNSPERITADAFVSRILENGTEYNFETELFQLLSKQQQTKICESILADSDKFNAGSLSESYQKHLLTGSFSGSVSAEVLSKAVDRYAKELAILDSSLYSYYSGLSGEKKAEALTPMLNQTYTDEASVAAEFLNSMVLHQFRSVSLAGEIQAVLEDNAVLLGEEAVEKLQGYTPARQNAILKYLMEKKKNIDTFAELVKEMNYAIENITGKPSGNGGGGGGGSTPKPTVTKPSTSVTVSEDVEKEPPKDEKPYPFTDCPEGFWAADAIAYLYKEEIVAGKEGNRFEPENSVTRAEFVKMLIQWYQLTDEEATCSFADVPANHWAYKYIASGFTAGVVNGSSATSFQPDSTITREDMAVMLQRLLGYKSALPPVEAEELNYTDGESISDYAVDAVKLLNAFGIVRGYADGSFQPKKTVTRAEAAQILYNASTNEAVHNLYYGSLIEKEYESGAGSGSGGNWWENQDTDYVQGESPAEYIPRPEYVPGPDDINVIYKGKYLFFETKPMMKNARVMVPVRNVFGIFGMEIQWNEESQTAVCRNETHTIEITADKGTAVVNGQEASLDVPAFVTDGRLYVPLRFLGEALGISVSWDEAKRAVIIG